MNKIDRMIEKKEQLKLQIEQELKLEQEKFGRWFFNKTNVNSSADAKRIVNDLFELMEETSNENEVSTDEFNEVVQEN